MESAQAQTREAQETQGTQETQTASAAAAAAAAAAATATEAAATRGRTQKDQHKNQTILQLNQDLLNSIASGDYTTYSSLCATDLTCFEPETTGVLVQGLSFHKYYFDLDGAMKERCTVSSSSMNHLRGSNSSNNNDVALAGGAVPVAGAGSRARAAVSFPLKNISMSNPHLRWLGDDAVIISYTRLDQTLQRSNSSNSSSNHNNNKPIMPAPTPVTKKMSETRVWERRNGVWEHVHFHKS